MTYNVENSFRKLAVKGTTKSLVTRWKGNFGGAFVVVVMFLMPILSLLEKEKVGDRREGIIGGTWLQRSSGEERRPR